MGTSNLNFGISFLVPSYKYQQSCGFSIVPPMPSILCSPNTIPTDTNMTALPKAPQPSSSSPYFAFSRSSPRSVNRWLSQQQLQSTNQQTPRIMSGANNSYQHQSNHTNGDHLNEEFTFTTEVHDHVPNNHTNHLSSQLWAPSQPSMYHPAVPLQLHTQPTGQQSRLSQSPSYPDNQWTDYSPYSSASDQTSPSNYMLPQSQFSPSTLAPYSLSPTTPTHVAQISPVGSDQSLSPCYPGSPHLPSPSTPGSTTHSSFMPSPTMSDMNMLLLDTQGSSSHSEKQRYTHREQLQRFKEAFALPMDGAGPFLPQQMYKPHTTSDRKRYVEEVLLEGPLYFMSENSLQYGILLKDALHFRTKKLRDRDQVVFEGRGPSVSIRLEWPGYRQWSRQIPTKDFRSPPQPITLAKLAKNVAKCVQRFMQDRKNLPMEEDADPQWKIGDGPNDIKLDDLVLVSIHHVSLGSWQPHLRLVRPPAGRRRVGQAPMTMPPTPVIATNTSPSITFPRISS